MKNDNSPREKRSAGRPRFEPTDVDRKQVEAMSGYGVPFDQIACLVGEGIDLKTLKKHFRRELDTGKAKANAKVGRRIYQKIEEGDTTAMIWWTKCQMGWTDKTIVDHTSSDGSMATVPVAAAILAALNKAHADD